MSGPYFLNTHNFFNCLTTMAKNEKQFFFEIHTEIHFIRIKKNLRAGSNFIKIVEFSMHHTFLNQKTCFDTFSSIVIEHDPANYLIVTGMHK